MAEEQKAVTVSVYMPDEIATKLLKLAIEEDRSISQMAQILIREALKARR